MHDYILIVELQKDDEWKVVQQTRFNGVTVKRMRTMSQKIAALYKKQGFEARVTLARVIS